MNNFVDPTKPYNDLPLLPPQTSFDDVVLWKRVVKASDALSKLNGQVISTLGNLNASLLMLDPLYAPEAAASSAVENIVTTTDEILKAKVLTEFEMTSQQKEGLNYKRALFDGGVQLGEQGFLNTNSFITIQKQLVGDGSGIRKLPGTKLADPISGKVYYTPPEGEKLIRDLLQNFEMYINDSSDDVDPLIKMAVLHYQFEAIHPFHDGNGRTGRILMPLYLVLSNKLTHPVLFLSEYILQHRDEYYQRLRAVTYEGDWKGWVIFVLEAVEKQAGKTSRILVKVSELQNDFKEKAIAVLGKLKAGDIVDYIFINPYFTREQMAHDLDIHPNTAAKYGDVLASAGLVVKTRYKKTVIYMNLKLIQIIS